jgi:BlaI family transcriptional regulator, penicillinase repressor
MRQRTSTLTPQELAIMKVVWRLGTATVRDVYEALREERTIAYTTVMTMMRILDEKRYLDKTLEDRAHVYKPTKAQHQVVGAMVKDFVDRVFDGASESLLVHLAKDNRLTAKQRQAIGKLIDKLED